MQENWDETQVETQHEGQDGNKPVLSLFVSNLRLKFPGEKSLVFKDLSFAVPVGQKVLLLGPSGCGKSTLLQVLSGMIPTSMEVPLKYEGIKRPDSWGFVFQDPDTQFCMPFVDEELAFVMENLSIPRAQMELGMKRTLESVGLQLDNLHTSIHTFSQGMKQRLALASVLLLQPDVLFLDEPSALLDPEGTEQIWDTVKKISADKTILIVEHKIEQMVDWVDRVVLFNHRGEIIGDGIPNEVFRDHQDELVEYGIWYPEVWQDYIATEAYRVIIEGRQSDQWGQGARGERSDQNRQSAKNAQSTQSIQSSLSDRSSQDDQGSKVPLLSLRDFAGFHGQIEKIKVSQADVFAGEWIAVMGDNGAGKSTLLLSIMQLLYTSGSYSLMGKAVPQSKRKGKKNKTIPQEIAFVFQNPELQFITNSLYDELAYSLRMAGQSEAEVERTVRQALEQFDIPIEEQRHPFLLSVGQKRRLSVASMMVMKQPILLLDEPTFGQDAKNTFSILERVEKLRSEGTAIIMVTHDLNIANHFATCIWNIGAGQLIDEGQPNRMELQTNELLYT